MQIPSSASDVPCDPSEVRPGGGHRPRCEQDRPTEPLLMRVARHPATSVSVPARPPRPRPPHGFAAARPDVASSRGATGAPRSRPARRRVGFTRARRAEPAAWRGRTNHTEPGRPPAALACGSGPRSSGDRAAASGAVRAGSNPAGGAGGGAARAGPVTNVEATAAPMRAAQAGSDGLGPLARQGARSPPRQVHEARRDRCTKPAETGARSPPRRVHEARRDGWTNERIDHDRTTRGQGCRHHRECQRLRRGGGPPLRGRRGVGGARRHPDGSGPGDRRRTRRRGARHRMRRDPRGARGGARGSGGGQLRAARRDVQQRRHRGRAGPDRPDRGPRVAVHHRRAARWRVPRHETRRPGHEAAPDGLHRQHVLHGGGHRRSRPARLRRRQARRGRAHQERGRRAVPLRDTCELHRPPTPWPRRWLPWRT